MTRLRPTAVGARRMKYTVFIMDEFRIVDVNRQMSTGTILL